MEAQGEDWLPCVIHPDGAFVPMTEMALLSDLAPCLVEPQAGLPLKVEIWTYMDLCSKCFYGMV